MGVQDCGDRDSMEDRVHLSTCLFVISSLRCIFSPLCTQLMASHQSLQAFSVAHQGLEASPGLF